MCIRDSPHPHHGQLDHVGRRALNGGVAGHALTAGTHVEVGACQLRQRPAAAEQGGHIAVRLGVGDGLVHIAAHIGEGGQIVFEEGVCFLDAHPDVLGQAVGTLAVHDAKVDGLGAGCLLYTSGAELRDTFGYKARTSGFDAWCTAFHNRKYDSGFAREMSLSLIHI